MTKLLKFQWAMLVAASLALAVAVPAYQVSIETDRTAIVLAPGAKTKIEVFRLFPASFNASLEFAARGNGLRPELGSYATQEDFRKTGKLNFIDPGSPVKLEVRVMETGAERILEAKPAGTATGRRLVPFVDDGDPHSFVWIPPSSARLPLPQGHATVYVKVLDVGPLLANEEVSLLVDPPITLKSVEPGYGFLFWVGLWPFIATLLALYACGLLLVSSRQRIRAMR